MRGVLWLITTLCRIFRICSLFRCCPGGVCVLD